jgi:hypothetical protein
MTPRLPTCGKTGVRLCPRGDLLHTHTPRHSPWDRYARVVREPFQEPERGPERREQRGDAGTSSADGATTAGSGRSSRPDPDKAGSGHGADRGLLPRDRRHAGARPRPHGPAVAAVLLDFVLRDGGHVGEAAPPRPPTSWRRRTVSAPASWCSTWPTPPRYPAISQPLFQTGKARVTLKPCMNLDDVQRGLSQLPADVTSTGT